MSAPAEARHSAIARPMPWPAPVTTASFPSRLNKLSAKRAGVVAFIMFVMLLGELAVLRTAMFRLGDGSAQVTRAHVIHVVERLVLSGGGPHEGVARCAGAAVHRPAR